MRNFFVLLFVMFSVVLFAQDRITLSDGTSRTGKIISEDQNFVRMKLDGGTARKSGGAGKSVWGTGGS